MTEPQQPHPGWAPPPAGPPPAGAQFGPSQEPGQPAGVGRTTGWDSATIPAASATSRRFSWTAVRPVLLGALGTLVFAVLLTGFWRPGYFLIGELDVHAADARVKQVLTDPLAGYGIADITEVRCNGGQNPEIKVNGTFTCQVTITGAKRTVTVTFADQQGGYWIGSPS